MATLEMLRNLRVPMNTPREVEPIVSFGNGGSSDDDNSRDSDEDPTLRELTDCIQRNTVSKIQEKNKKQLKKRIEDEKNKHDFRCIFVNSRTCARCTNAKYKDYLYCKQHKSYVKKKEKTKEIQEMSLAITKEKKEVLIAAKETKQKEALLSKYAEVKEKVKEVKKDKRKIDDSMLQFKVDSSKTLKQRLEEQDFEDLVSEEEVKLKKKKKTSKKVKSIKKSAQPKESDSEDPIKISDSEPELKKVKSVKKHKKNPPAKEADSESELMDQDNPVDSPTDSVMSSALSTVSLNSITNKTDEN